MPAIVADLYEQIREIAEDCEIIRFLPQVLDYGRVSKAEVEQIIPVRASIQPMTGRELQRVPEGLRTQGWMKGYFGVLVHDATRARVPDRIRYNGVVYEISKVDDWLSLGGYCYVEMSRMGIV